ncbi:MAG: hypothetical protein K9L25_05580 [Methylovulum sp.]|nr:hypothetical protein [Methylovulum sp.]
MKLKLALLSITLIPAITNAAEIWLEGFNGSTTSGTAYGLTYENTPTGGQGARFTRVSESRVQYPYSKGMPKSGTIEINLKVDSGYNYNNYQLSENNACALIFTTDVSGGDVTYPGSAWFYVCNNGDISLTISTIKYGTSPAQVLVVKGTAFRFGQWNTVSFSFGTGGQAIALNGKLVASNAKNTQQLGAGGTHGSAIDIPTLGESVPGYWSNNQYDGGFEGVVDTFRVSNSSKDWKLYPIPVKGTISWAKPPYSVQCVNNTTVQSIAIPKNTTASYDCEKAGLIVKSGDDISVTVRGKKY